MAAALEGHEGAGDIDPKLAADFLALGYCRLQVELLTRHMRYSVTIDELHFHNEAVDAARAAVAGDEATARQHLSACFDALYESRKHFYPVDVFLVDLTLLAETTIGHALRDELAAGATTNLLAPTSLIRQIADQEPATWRKSWRRSTRRTFVCWEMNRTSASCRCCRWRLRSPA